MTDLAARRAQLEKRLGTLTSRLRVIEDELDSHQSRDWEDLATEREGDEVLEGLGVAGQAEIGKIKAALSRMEAGEYGHCMRCGDAIAEARLDIVPFTPFCARCAT